MIKQFYETLSSNIKAFLTVCSCHVTYAFQSESCLNVKELLARSKHEIWRWSDCNWSRTQNHLILKRTLNHWPNWPNDWAVFWVLICTVHLTVCCCHVTYAFQSESTRYSCLNVKELLTRSRCEIWGLSDCNLTHNSTLTTENSRLASLAKWLSVRSWTKWFCGFEPSCSHLHHIACVEDGIWIKNLKESNSRKRRVTTFIRSSFIQVSNW